MKHRGSSQTVSFRLSGKLLQELERQAEEFGLSPGEMSRGGHEHEKVDLLVAKFLHSQSRGQDTKLHVHYIVLNTVLRRSDGNYSTLDLGPLLATKKLAGAAFRSALARALNLDESHDDDATK